MTEQTRSYMLRLADALVEDILSTPDREILAEFTDLNGDPGERIPTR